MPDLEKAALNIADLREMARRRLPWGLFEFIERGNEDDVALRNNRAAFDRIKLRPRVLIDVSRRDQSCTILGARQASPLIIAPTGPTGFVCHRGEVALARAASRAGIPITISAAAATPLEEIVRDGGAGPKWFQLYMSGDREASLALVDRVKAAGYETLVVTVDSPLSANRECVIRRGFSIPFRMTPQNIIDVACHPRWLIDTMGRYVISDGLPHLPNYPIPRPGDGPPVALKDASLTWDVLAVLRDKWPGKLLVKGILDPRDAVMCHSHGADGLIVSNHGAVMLDSSMAPVEALPEIIDAVAGSMPVLVDGGFRRGTDIVKALALGAAGVMIGRATLYGLGAAGEAGAFRALQLLSAEIDRTLAVLGCATLEQISRDHVILPRDPPLRVDSISIKPSEPI